MRPGLTPVLTYARPRSWRIRLLGVAVLALLCWQLAVSLGPLVAEVHPAGMPPAPHHIAPRPPAVAVTVRQGRQAYRYVCTVPPPPRTTQAPRRLDPGGS
jgi:hypothetical protein